MPSDKKGSIFLQYQNGTSKSLSPDEFEKKRSQIYDSDPGVRASHISLYDRGDEDIADDDRFIIASENDEPFEVDAKTFKANRDALYGAGFKKLNVQKVRPVKYFSEQGDEQKAVINNRIKAIEEAERETDKAARGAYKERQKEMDKRPWWQKALGALSQAERESNPYVADLKNAGSPDTYEGWLNTEERDSYGADLKNYQAAKRMLKDAQDLQGSLTKGEAKKNADAKGFAGKVQNFIKGSLQGQKQYVMNEENWSALLGMENAGAMYGLQQKIEDILGDVPENASGDDVEKAIKEGLSESERALFDSVQASGAVSAALEGEIAPSVKAGQTMAMSERMGLEFLLLNGAAGAGGRTAKRAVTRYLEKRLVKDGLGKFATGVAKGASRLVGEEAGALVGGALQTALGPSNYSEVAKSTQEAMKAFMSSPAAFMDPETRIKYGIEGPQKMGEMVWDGALNMLFENATEFGLGPVNKLTGAIGKAGYKGFKKLGWDTLANLMSPQVSAFLNRMGIQSLAEETGEEVNGAIIDYLRGNKEAIKDFADLENMGVLMASFIPTIGVGAGVSAVQRGVVNNRYNKAYEAYKDYLIDERGMSEEDADKIASSVKGENPEELGRKAAVLLNAVGNGNSQGKDVEGQLILDLLTAARDRNAAHGADQIRREDEHEKEREELYDRTGRKQFWRTREAELTDEGGTPYTGEEEYVDYLTTGGENNLFIRKENSDGSLDTVDENGNERTLSAQEVEQGLKDGTFGARRSMSVEDYLDLRNGVKKDAEWNVSRERVSAMGAYEEGLQFGDGASHDDVYMTNLNANEARNNAVALGVDEAALDSSPEEIARMAFDERQEGNLELADALSAYANAKGAQQGLYDGYMETATNRATVATDAAMNGAVLNDGTVITANLGDSPVYITSDDVNVARDGSVSVIGGTPKSMVMVRLMDGTSVPVPASDLSRATKTQAESFRRDMIDWSVFQAEDQYYQMANTVSPEGKTAALAPYVNHTILIEDPETGDVSSVTVLGVNRNTGMVTVKDATGNGPSRSISAELLYDTAQKDEQGNISLDVTSADNKVQQAPQGQQAPAPQTQQPVQGTQAQNPADIQGTTQTIIIDGEPVDVFVEQADNDSVLFSYENMNGETVNGNMSPDEFRQAMQGTQTPTPAPAPAPTPTPEPAPAQEPVAETAPAATESGIPLDEKTGEPIYDAEGITPEQAYDDIYGRFGEDTSDADSFVVEQSEAADKALARAQRAVLKADAEKAEIDKWKRNPGEGLNAFAKRKEDAKAEVDKKTAKYRDELPELQRKSDFWKEIKEVADENIAEAKKEAERQKLIEQYGVDPRGFNLTPQTMEEALANDLAGLFRSGQKLKLGSVLDLVGWDKRKDLRKNGYGFVLSNKTDAVPVDKFVMGVADDWPGYISDEQDAINMVGDLLMSHTRGELGQLIFNNRLEAARRQAENEETPAEAPATPEVPVAETPETPVEETTEVPVAETQTEETAEEPATEEALEDLPEDLPEAEEEAETETETATEEEQEEEQPEPEQQAQTEEEAPENNAPNQEEMGQENEAPASETQKESVTSQKEGENEAEQELTEEEIRNSGYPDPDIIDSAVDYINGEKGFAETLAYQQVKDYVRTNGRTTEQTGRNAGEAQLDGRPVQTPGMGAERSGGETVSVGGEGNGEGTPGTMGASDSGVLSGETGAQATGENGQRTRKGAVGSRDAGRRGGTDESGLQLADDAGGQSVDEGRTGETDKRGTEAGSIDIDALGGELEGLLDEFNSTLPSVTRQVNGVGRTLYANAPEGIAERDRNSGKLSRKRPKKQTASISLDGMTPKQQALAAKILFSSAKLGYAYAKTEGLTTFNDFRRWFKSKFGDAVMKGLNYDESSLDAFIGEVWNTKLNIEGKRLPLSGHSSEIHDLEIRDERDISVEERIARQQRANKKGVAVIRGSRKNIAESVPILTPGQWDDLVAIERQFFDESHNDYDHAYGKGMLVTNGTGTGKTFTGLGTIKRFIDEGKGRILVVAPASMKKEWSDKAKMLGIKLSVLENTKDKGEGAIVTSYENFRMNKALYEDTFDLVVYDECQNIIENQQGEETLAFTAHKRIANKDIENAEERLASNTELGKRRSELEARVRSLNTERKKPKPNKAKGQTKDERIAEIDIEKSMLEAEIQSLTAQIDAIKPQFRDEAEKAVKRTKVLMLSATPFNTIANLRYGAGFVFNYPQVFKSDGTEVTDEGQKESAFWTEWFRGDQPMEQLEVEFGDHLLDELETCYFRELENGYDYSREHPDVSGMIMATRFNQAMDALHGQKYKPLLDNAGFIDKPQWTSLLYETMKVSAMRDRLKEHLAAGRKIVIFHDRLHPTQSSKENLPPVGPPFQTVLDVNLMAKNAPIALIADFKRDFADVLKWEAGLDYRPVNEQVIDFFATDEDRAKYAAERQKHAKEIEEWQKELETYLRNHPDMTDEELEDDNDFQKILKKRPKGTQLEAESVAVYNGECTPKEKETAKAQFNDDNSKVKIICVTTRSGGAGLSLHDTTGVHQRVMIQTALPFSPIGFIQAEGRTFRWGNRSNAIFEYPRLGIEHEVRVFAMSFNAKAETVENIAHGFRGRGLKDSIMTGFYENSGNVPIDGEGIGGVERDRRGSTLTGMAKAKHDYEVAQRKGFKPGDKSIPEPIGFSIATWAQATSGDTALVPFAGRGSIARYVPTGITLGVMETDPSLQTDLLCTAGRPELKLREGLFGELNPINKADVVLLDGNYDEMTVDPIGSMRKGFSHLSEGGRMIAIIPDKYNATAELGALAKDGALTRMIIGVGKGVLDGNNEPMDIVIVDKVTRKELRNNAPAAIINDLTNLTKEQLFDQLENIKVPERIVDVQAIKSKKVKAVLTELRKNKLIGKAELQREETDNPQVYIYMTERFGKGMNQSRFSLESCDNSYWIDTSKWQYIRFSKAEKVNQDNPLIQNYQWLKETLALTDGEFRKKTRTYDARQEDVEALKDLYRSYMKLIRGLFNLTEAQINRVAQGLNPNISASDIETLDGYGQLREKFEAANHGDEERQDMYDRVADVAEKIGLVIGVESMGRGFAGGYNNRSNSLKINRLTWGPMNDDERATTLLHEFIHSVTNYALKSAEEGVPNAKDGLYDSANLARDIFRQITKGTPEDVAPLRGYSLENVDEMMAEMANPKIRDRYKNRRMWVDHSGSSPKVYGFQVDGAEETTAWALLNEALDGILKNFDKSLFDRFIGRSNDFMWDLSKPYVREADKPKGRVWVSEDGDVLGNEVVPETDTVDDDLSDEEKTIKENAIAEGTFMKAPNGNPTNLSEKQWLQVRTAAFKNWFGNWDIAAMTTPILKSEGTFTNLSEAEDWAKKNLQGKGRTNRFTGDYISIGRRSVKEMLNEKALKNSDSINAHLSALRSVLDFIETGIPAETHRDVHGRDFDVMRLYNAIEIDGELYRVKSTVKKVRSGDRYYTYEVQEMELMEERRANRESEGQSPVTTNSPINSITGAKLLKGVKKTNSSEEILDYSKIVDENGEPRVLYHGTKRQFWSFDPSQARKYTDGMNFFSLDREFSESWINRDDDRQRSPEDNKRLEDAWQKSREHKAEIARQLAKTYGRDYIDSEEWKEAEKGFEQWERDNLGLDGMTVREARMDLGKRLLPVFINSRNPYIPTERYDIDGKQMLIDLGVMENPDAMADMYARGGAYIYYERKRVTDELKRRGYDSIYLSEDVWSDPSKNLRTLGVWDANRIKSATDNNGEFNPENNDIRYREETDADTIERLDSEPTVTAYRAMQFVPNPNGDVEYDLGDGRGVQRGYLYPPMSAVVEGEWRPPVPFNKWERSVERPDLVDEKGRFKLDKGNKKSLNAAYNPYFHSSGTMLNDQFSEAQDRGNLVVVEVQIPEREVSERNMNPYKAEKAKDAVGKLEWKAGPIQGQLTGTRPVYLSRWDKPVRIVPVSEVADNVAAQIAGQVETMPTNVVWPQLRSELKKRGVKFVETDNQGYLVGGENEGKSYSSVYGKKKTSKEQREAKKARDEREAAKERIRLAEVKATNETLDRMGQELGVKINKVGRSEMPAGHKTAKGYYNPKTGEMTICMDNVTDERDAIATVIHETVGHKGLRELFGPRFREAMVNIYASLDAKGRAWVNGYIARHGLGFGDEGIAHGMEEYMAHLAENGDFRNKTVWEKIKEILGRIVDAVFGTDGFVFTDNELNYILRASYEHLKNPNWLDTIPGWAKDTLMKRALGINETGPNRPTDPEGPGMGLRFRDGETGIANEDYNADMKLSKNAAIMENQNADLPVKIGYEKILKEKYGDKWLEKMKDLRDDEDYLTRHNLASSRAETEAHNFELFRFTPLMEQVRAVQKKLVGDKSNKQSREDAYERILDYIYAVSGLERNEYKNNEIEAEKQDALKALDDALAQKIDEINNSGKTEGEKADAIDRAKKSYDKKRADTVVRYDAMKKDWSGLTSLTGHPSNEWMFAEADARALVDSFKKAVGDDAMLDALWDRIRDCTDFSLEHAYKYGLLTREEFERLHGTATQPRMWQYYVPLRGFNEETAEETFDYSRFLSPSNGGAVVKEMKGRWTEADNPLANILNIAESEIVQGNDNWAKQALYRFVLNAGENSLLTQVEPWYTKNPATGEWSLTEPYEGETLEDFEKRMQMLRALDEPLAKKGRRGLKLDKIMANKAHRNEHMIRLKVGGMDKMIWVNGNPALAKAVSGMSRAQNMKWLRRASRVLSNLFTTYSLDFSVKNLIRDTIYSRSALLVKEDRAYRRQYEKNWWNNFGYGAFAFPMIRLAAQWESGKLQSKPENLRTKKEQQFIDFMTDGGQTGYTIINSVNEIKKSLERSMRRAGEKTGKVTIPILGWYAEGVKTLNEAFELLTRFTAYQTSRDMGRSGQRSASDAKEISVNFNRRGAQSGEGVWGNIAAYLGATHYFYNAGVQGFDNFLRLFKTNPVKMGTITGGLVVMGMVTPLLNSMLAGAFGGGDGGDDDWYWNLPEWVRRNNIVIGTGRWYLAIPLAVEFRAPYGLGDIASSAFCYHKTPTRGSGDVPFGDLALDFINTAANILPVNPVEGYTPSNSNIGDALIRAVAPDAGMFFVDWATNRDYTGRPLWKENPFNETVPKSQGAYASTPKGIVAACQKIAEVTGGRIDIAPGLVRDAMNNYGGGFFRVAEDASKVLTGIFDNDPERPFRWDNVPFFSGFTGHIDEDRMNSYAVNALREYEELSEENVKRLNAVCNTSDLTAAMVYGDTPVPEQYESKVNVWKTLHPKAYELGRMYREGMNNTYKMKQYVRGAKAGQWHKSNEVEQYGVTALKKQWKTLRDEWAAMPENTLGERSLKAEKLLEVQQAWHTYYDAEGNLADRLMKYEYGK